MTHISEYILGKYYYSGWYLGNRFYSQLAITFAKYIIRCFSCHPLTILREQESYSEC